MMHLHLPKPVTLALAVACASLHWWLVLAGAIFWVVVREVVSVLWDAYGKDIVRELARPPVVRLRARLDLAPLEGDGQPER